MGIGICEFSYNSPPLLKYPLRQIGFFVVVLVDNWWESAFNKSLIRIVE